MKALTYRKFGDAQVLHIEDMPEPQISEDGVLVRLCTSTVNVIDYRSRNGFLSPFVDKKFPKIPGVDLAGVVIAVGHKVKRFKIGDDVFGATNPFKGGAFAEVVAIQESALCAKPDSLSFNEAATLPITGLAALQALRDLAKIKDGDEILVYGSSGSMGLFTIQIAKQYGAHVTAVCGTQGVPITKSMGADVVLDYKAGLVIFENNFDAILDLSSHFPFSLARKYLKPNGRFIEPSPTIPKFIGSKLANPFRTQKHLMLQTASRPEDLAFLASLVISGKLKVIIAKTYPLLEAKEAFFEMEKGGTVGKIVVTVN